MKLRAVLRTIILLVHHAVSPISGTSRSDCCPSFYKLDRTNICVSNVNSKEIENIREDFTKNCKGRLKQIDAYDISETYYEGKIVKKDDDYEKGSLFRFDLQPNICHSPWSILLWNVTRDWSEYCFGLWHVSHRTMYTGMVWNHNKSHPSSLI